MVAQHDVKSTIACGVDCVLATAPENDIGSEIRKE